MQTRFEVLQIQSVSQIPSLLCCGLGACELTGKALS